MVFLTLPFCTGVSVLCLKSIFVCAHLSQCGSNTGWICWVLWFCWLFLLVKDQIST